MLSIYDIFETSFRLLGQHLWQASQKKFADTVESIQYNTALAMAGAIKGTPEEKLYNELGLEYLKDRRWMRRLCLFPKIYNLKSPKYLYNVIPSITRFYDTRNNTNVPSSKCRTEHFKNSFFPNFILNGTNLTLILKSWRHIRPSKMLC